MMHNEACEAYKMNTHHVPLRQNILLLHQLQHELGSPCVFVCVCVCSCVCVCPNLLMVFPLDCAYIIRNPVQ